jgi:HK97 family phage portal protein
MSLFKRYVQTAADLIPSRMAATRGTVTVNNETALRHSAVWACLRLRANLVSSLPVKMYREMVGVQVEIPKPKLLVNPSGERIDIGEWMYSTQFDLDRAGNDCGLITETDRYGLPQRVDLVGLSDWSAVIRKGELSAYRIGGELYPPEKIWHEKQYTVAGMHLGLSPIAYAAWSIGEYLSIQDFALDWFGNMTMPSVHVKNTAIPTLTPTQADELKARYKASVKAGEPFVSGQDYELTPITMANQANNWIEGKQYGVADIARFFDCPGDLIDAAVTSGNITYANITQRNLQFLIMHLGPAVVRRENALTRTQPAPRYVKLNTDALLRMDPQTQALTLQTQIDSRTLAPSEARAIRDLPPFTETQLAEFDRLFGKPGAKAPQPLVPKLPTGATP